MTNRGFEEHADPSGWENGSPWAGALRSRFPTMELDRSVDVLVVGAGLAGLLIATELRKDGRDVLIVDRHTVGGVATRNSTAKVSALQGSVYRELIDRRGIETATAYAAAQVDAVGAIRRLVEELHIDCALTTAPAYTYATEPDAGERARAEFEAAIRAGLAVTWESDSELPFPIVGAVRLDEQLHLDPGALCDALARELGPGRVAEHAVVLEVDEQHDGCRVLLEGGTTISANHVVIATQAPIVDPGLIVNRCEPRQSYALAARLPTTVPVGMYLSCDRSVRSLRPASVDGETLAVIGGEGHPMGGDAQPGRWNVLAAWTDEHFGESEVIYQWATHDLVPTDHVPFIGRLSAGSHRQWVATGFAKWGMTNSYVAARLITEGISGRSVDWASTFDSTRIASTVNRSLLPIGKTVTEHLVIDRVKRRPEPRCTHQGCVLRRDDALGTWDCPCHGSRFAADGSVIQGPATRPVAT